MNTEKRRILIVEDDAAIRCALEEALAMDGHETTTAADGAEAVRLIQAHSFDLILLDIMLPRVNGYDVCRRIREKDRAVSVIMLTAKTEEIDKVIGLELGADDYVTKPFGVREILARVHSAFRRQEAFRSVVAPPADIAPHANFAFGEVTVDRRRFCALVSGAVVELTPRELNLLDVFWRRKGEVLSRDTLLNEVWGIDYLGTTRTLDQHIAQLRKKIGDSSAKVIRTIHGIGYQYMG